MSKLRESLSAIVWMLALFVAIIVVSEQRVPAQNKSSGGSGTSTSSVGARVSRSPAIRIGVFVTIVLVSIPIYMMWLYSIILNNSSYWPTTLYGACLGLWGVTALISFGWIFPAHIPLKDLIPGPWANYRLQQVTTILAIAWAAGSYFYYRRPAPTGTVK